MTDESGAYFFDFPNNLGRFPGSRGLLAAGCSLTFIGLACLVNGMIGLAFGGVKYYGNALFFNSHWINVAYILAGIMVILLEKQKQNFLLFGSLALTIMSICMSVGVSISDGLNIRSMMGMAPALRETYRAYGGSIHAAWAYSAVDLVCNITAFFISTYAFWKVLNEVKRFYSQLGPQNMRVIISGAVLFLISLANFITHIVEATDMNSFINYTMDEPFWNLVAMATGILVIFVGYSGSRIMTHTALLLCLILYYPRVEYLILEYRWLLHYVLVRAVLSKTHKVTTQIGLAMNVLFICVNCVTCVILARRLSEKGAWFDLHRTYDKNVKKQLVVIPIALILMGAMLIVIDVAHSNKGSIFRLFMASDQKLPFVLIPVGLVTLCLQGDLPIIYLLYPFSFALCILGLTPAIRTVSAFIYLTDRLYLRTEVCGTLRFEPKVCLELFEMHAALAHFLEALLSFFSIMFLTYMAFILSRIMGIYATAIEPGYVTEEQQQKIRKLTIVLRILGAGNLALSLVCFTMIGGSTKIFITDTTSGMITLHNYVMFWPYYLTPLSIGICQIFWARNDVSRVPLRMIALMMLSTARLVEIFMIMDQKTLGGVSWSLVFIIIGEILTISLAFATLIVSGHLLNASVNALPQFDFLDDDPEGERSHEMNTFEQQMYHQLDFQPSGILDMRFD